MTIFYALRRSWRADGPCIAVSNTGRSRGWREGGCFLWQICGSELSLLPLPAVPTPCLARPHEQDKPAHHHRKPPSPAEVLPKLPRSSSQQMRQPNTDIPIFSIVEFSINTDSSSVHSISYTFTVLNPDKVASINISVYNSSNDIIYTNTLTSIQSTISVSSNAITISQSGTCRIEASVIAANIELTTVYEETYGFTMPPALTTPPPNTIFYILVAVPNNGGYEIKFITKDRIFWSALSPVLSLHQKTRSSRKVACGQGCLRRSSCHS